MSISISCIAARIGSRKSQNKAMLYQRGMTAGALRVHMGMSTAMHICTYLHIALVKTMSLTELMERATATFYSAASAGTGSDTSEPKLLINSLESSGYCKLCS